MLVSQPSSHETWRAGTISERANHIYTLNDLLIFLVLPIDIINSSGNQSNYF